MLKLATKFRPDPKAFSRAHEAGFRCAELFLNAEVLAGWRSAVAWAGPYSFEYVLHFPNSLPLERATLQECVELYRALGCRCMVIHQPMFDRFAAILREFAPDVCLAIENHKLTPAEIDQWAESSPALTLDVEHLWKYTLQDAPLAALLEAVERVLTAAGSKLRHVHLPGYWVGFAEHRPMYCSREMIFPVFDLFAAKDFSGLIVSEANPKFQNAHELRMDVLLFEAWKSSRTENAVSPEA